MSRRQPGEVVVELSASYYEDDKIAGVSPLAELLFVRALCFARRNLTDGAIRERQLSRIAVGLEGAEQLAEELVDVGLWRQTPAGWRIAKYLKRNPSRTEIATWSDTKRRAAIAGNHRRWHRTEPSEDCPLCTDPDESSTESPRTDDRTPIAPAIGPANRSESYKRIEDERIEKRGSSSSSPTRTSGERPDVDALRSAGFRRVTARQRRILDEIADRHTPREGDPSPGRAWSAATIRATPAGQDPLEYLMGEDRRVRDERQARAEADRRRREPEPAAPAMAAAAATLGAQLGASTNGHHRGREVPPDVALPLLREARGNVTEEQLDAMLERHGLTREQLDEESEEAKRVSA